MRDPQELQVSLDSSFANIRKTKKHDNFGDISVKEKLQIKSTEAFFKTLQEKSVNVYYKTKINSDKLFQMISDILKKDSV